MSAKKKAHVLIKSTLYDPWSNDKGYMNKKPLKFLLTNIATLKYRFSDLQNKSNTLKFLQCVQTILEQSAEGNFCKLGSSNPSSNDFKFLD